MTGIYNNADRRRFCLLALYKNSSFTGEDKGTENHTKSHKQFYFSFHKKSHSLFLYCIHKLWEI